MDRKYFGEGLSLWGPRWESLAFPAISSTTVIKLLKSVVNLVSCGIKM